MSFIIKEEEIKTIDGQDVLDQEGKKIDLKKLCYQIAVFSSQDDTPEKKYQLALLADKIFHEKELNLEERTLLVQQAKKYTSVSTLLPIVKKIEGK